MTTGQSPTAPEEIFAVDFAALAREIAMDIFPIGDVLRLHDLSDEEWAKIQDHPKFQQILTEMIQDWNSAGSTLDRVRVKSATGLETVLHVYIHDIADRGIPLNQRVEAGKFLAKLGELDGSKIGGGALGSQFSISINIGDDKKAGVTIDHIPTPAVADE